MATGRKGWGFKIDYAAAIRDDETIIAALTEEIANGWYQVVQSTRNPDFAWTAHTLRDLVFYVPGAAARVGLTPVDVADLAWYCEVDPMHLVATHGELPSETKGRSGYARGKALAAKLDRPLQRDETTAKKFLKLAKASLARHKRNQSRASSIAAAVQPNISRSRA